MPTNQREQAARFPSDPDVFEYRSTSALVGGTEQKHLHSLIVVAAVVVMLLSSMWMMGIENWTDFQTAWLARAQPSDAAGSFFTRQGPVWDPTAFLPSLFALIFGLALWGLLLAQRRCTLRLDTDSLTQSCDLPFGLGRFTPYHWTVPLPDICAIEYFRNPVQPVSPSIYMVTLQIKRGQGKARVIAPAHWYHQGEAAQPAPRPMSQAKLFTNPSTTWALPENQAIMRQAVANLPLAKALRERGFEISKPDFNDSARDQNFFSSPSVKYAIVIGAGLVLLTLFLMISRPYQHLQSLPSIWAVIASCIAVLAIFLLASKKESPPPVVVHKVVAGLSLVAGITMAAPPLVLLVNGLGIESSHIQEYVVHKGLLEPVNAPDLGLIELPGKQGRIGFLREGSRLSLNVKRGRLGLLEYDDTPLREEADKQNIQ